MRWFDRAQTDGLVNLRVIDKVGISVGGPGYGRSDGFAMSNRLLAAVLPEHRVTNTAGGHEWAPWLRIRETLLERRPSPGCVRTATRTGYISLRHAQ